MRIVVLCLAGGVLLAAAVAWSGGLFRQTPPGPEPGPTAGTNTQPLVEDKHPPAGLQKATFGGGCFWCTEAVFRELRGVVSVTPGYSGGTVENPTYQQVCGGWTGHAEVIQVAYDPAVLSYPELLAVFWGTHDPTTKNRQGADVGTQYRSVIFTHDARQKALAQEYREKLDQSGEFANPIVTEIVPFKAFYPAEDYHQNYYANNPTQGYCAGVIAPKVAKFRKLFKAWVKTPAPGR
jgi:peptide-methionine (S)-S-oxide reductase